MSTFEGLKSDGLPTIFCWLDSKVLAGGTGREKEGFSHPSQSIFSWGRIFLASKLWMTNNLYARTLPGYL